MPEDLSEIMSIVLNPSCFFIPPPFGLCFEETSEERISWEIFHGRLLPPSQTRQQGTFHSWKIYLMELGKRSSEPILSIKLDRNSGCMYITRAVNCHLWEAYQSEEKTILSRMVTGWMHELVGSIAPDDFGNEKMLAAELGRYLFRAVIGLSRLPLSSVESPLPAFTLGQFGYFFQQWDTANDTPQLIRSCHQLISVLSPALGELEKIKLVELVLRAACDEQMPDLTRAFFAKWQECGWNREDIAALLRSLINNVSLSPWTDFARNLLAFVRSLVSAGALTVADHIDFLGFVLRQVARHLTAYDLITFHHQGANYPDALLLDAVLKEYFQLMEQHPDLFLAEGNNVSASKTKRLRRQALRQGWLLRRFYEGLAVPDAPTSPGENARVMPPPHLRVPEEQITQPAQRTKKLYQDDPLEKHLGVNGSEILRQGICDLAIPDEVRELGMAVFIDRPLGLAKKPGEPDSTLLFSHEAFSHTIARDRLVFLSDHVPQAEQCPWDDFHHVLNDEVKVTGIPANRYRDQHHGVVSLADVARSADDFILIRTTPSTVKEFIRQYAVARLAQQFDLQFLIDAKNVLILPDPAGSPHHFPMLAIYDEQLRKRVEMEVDLSHGYKCRGGFEYPAAGLRVVRIDDQPIGP